MERIPPEWALIIAGGKKIQVDLLDHLDHPACIIAADSGLDHAYALGLHADLVVGDMDSVTDGSLARATVDGIAIERHPADKDATDLELAIDAAATRGFGQATIIGGTGGRFAHTLANALLLTRTNQVRLDWLTSHARIAALRAGDYGEFKAAEGPLLSVLAVGGPARCLSSGLRWPLDNTSLRPGSTRGISNEIITAEASVTVEEGCLLVIHERDHQ